MSFLSSAVGSIRTQRFVRKRGISVTVIVLVINVIYDGDFSTLEPFDLGKLKNHVESLCYGLNTDFVISSKVVDKVNSGVYDGVAAEDISVVAAETAANMTSMHYDYGLLAGRLEVYGLHKQTCSKFSEAVQAMYANNNLVTGERAPLVSKELYEVVMGNKEVLDGKCDYSRDYSLSFFSIRTLKKSYLLRGNGRIMERPQHLFMRVALGIHCEDLPRAIQTYDYMSRKYFIHATPTLFNAGTPSSQLASCFLAQIKEDSVNGIFDTVKDCALISKHAGGIGINVNNVRAVGSPINGTNGKSNGLVPMLKVFNSTARYIDQGGNKRPGAIAVYIEPWHADVFSVLELKRNTGQEDLRARDLFYALWVPDLFMRRVRDDMDWSLFCPSEAPGLMDVWGSEFDRLYEQYEVTGRARSIVRARQLWGAIVKSQIETGGPFMVYKDHSNEKSNQKNLGTIKGSNLCTEIIQYSSPEEVSVCNLASVALAMFVVEDERSEQCARFDFQKLHEVVKIVAFNLNRVIDRTSYPVPEARFSNLRNRPIGIGVQGLADAFLALKLEFESPGARILNIQIFETIYHAALEVSCELAEVEGSYDTWAGSPSQEGLLQYDLWGVKPSDLWDWSTLKDSIRMHGLRNSLVVAPMPTASTSQILGYNESFEPYTSNLYSRRVLAGEFQVVCPWLIRDLVKLGLWNEETRRLLLLNDGSVQSVPSIPPDVKRLYKTVWEIPQRVLIDLAADRGAFVDQSQSLSIYLSHPSLDQMLSMHFYGWTRGLKTSMYYLRTKPAASAIPFTVEGARVGQVNVFSSNERRGDASSGAETDSLVAGCIVDGVTREECQMCSG